MTAGRVAAGRFLFVLWDGGGNVAPQLGLAARLRDAGTRCACPGVRLSAALPDRLAALGERRGTLAGVL
jgi:hypothetical protein